MARGGQQAPEHWGQARGRERSQEQGQARGRAMAPALAQDAVLPLGTQQSQGREEGAKGCSLWGASILWGDKGR